MLRRAMLSTALVIGLLASLPAAASEGPLVGNVEAVKVVVADDGRETFVPAEQAKPSDVIEYRLTYSNNGEAAVRNISITDPIPTGTRYLLQTATRPQHGRVEFSIDGGKEYSPWPIYITKKTPEGNEYQVQATPEMITHIRWVIDSDFEPDTEITFSYRTVVK